ncbi:MAG: hypothetical protein R2706_08535 [Acidimicrobiales bacterium]
MAEPGSWLTDHGRRSAARDDGAHALQLDVPGWAGHCAGQHVDDIRLTGPDGYQASRSYSLSSAPGEPPQITVSGLTTAKFPYLVDVAEVGDEFGARPRSAGAVWELSPRRWCSSVADLDLHRSEPCGGLRRR